MHSIGAPPRSRTEEDYGPGELTVQEFERLSWFKATCVARLHLQRTGLAPELDAARHFAFGLWLRASGRLDGEFRPDAPSGALRC